MKDPNRVRAGRALASKVWPKTCPHCGTPFLGTGKQMYCTRKCKSGASAPPRRPKTCGWCGADIPAAIGSQKYCSVDCRRKARYPRAVPRTCAVCPREFVPARRRLKQITCSATCRTIHQSQRKLLVSRPEMAAAKLDADLEGRNRERPETDEPAGG